MARLASQYPESGSGTVALALRALAEVLEQARIHRLTRNQHILFRLGELIAAVEGAESLARRAVRSASDELPTKTDKRFDAEGVAAISRVYAREAALKVAQEGSRWVLGAAEAGAIDAQSFESAVDLAGVRQAQDGLLADMDKVADIIYDRQGAE